MCLRRQGSDSRSRLTNETRWRGSYHPRVTSDLPLPLQIIDSIWNSISAAADAAAAAVGAAGVGDFDAVREKNP